MIPVISTEPSNTETRYTEASKPHQPDMSSALHKEEEESEESEAEHPVVLPTQDNCQTPGTPVDSDGMVSTALIIVNVSPSGGQTDRDSQKEIQ